MISTHFHCLMICPIFENWDKDIKMNGKVTSAEYVGKLSWKFSQDGKLNHLINSQLPLTTCFSLTDICSEVFSFQSLCNQNCQLRVLTLNFNQLSYRYQASCQRTTNGKLNHLINNLLFSNWYLFRSLFFSKLLQSKLLTKGL